MHQNELKEQVAADEFSAVELALHIPAKCDEATCRICAKNYPDIAAAARAINSK